MLTSDLFGEMFSSLPLAAALCPPSGAGFHTYPPIEAFQYFECVCVCKNEVIRGIGVACVHDPRSGRERHINADGVIEEGAAPAAVVSIRRQGNDDRFSEE